MISRSVSTYWREEVEIDAVTVIPIRVQEYVKSNYSVQCFQDTSRGWYDTTYQDEKHANGANDITL